MTSVQHSPSKSIKVEINFRYIHSWFQNFWHESSNLAINVY